MEISNNYTSYNPYMQQSQQKSKIDSNENSFKVIDSSQNRDNTSGQNQYIKNYNKIIDEIYRKNSDTPEKVANAEDYVKLYEEHGDKLMTRGFLDPYSNLTDEFTNAYINTYNTLNPEEQVELTLFNSLHSQKDILESSTKTIAYFEESLIMLKKNDKNANIDNSSSIKLMELFYKNYIEELDQKEISNKSMLKQYSTVY